uniref:Uncharacterized protein n=1 Tax=Oryza punctata TaxID=4537 RepID=A0A0E0MLV8_ORYPU
MAIGTISSIFFAFPHPLVMPKRIDGNATMPFPALVCSGARTGCHRRISVVAPATVDQIRPSRRASVFASSSSPFPLKIREECCTGEGDHAPYSSPPI